MLTYIYLAVGTSLILLLVSPVLLLTKSTLTGFDVLVFGWGGIFYGVISWFWFVGLYILIQSIRKKIMSNTKCITLSIFFVLCIVTIPFGFTIGMNAPGDPTGSQSENLLGFGAGIFMYVCLISYLLSVVGSMYLLKFSDFNTKIVKISSIYCILLIAMIFFYFYTTEPETFLLSNSFLLRK